MRLEDKPVKHYEIRCQSASDSYNGARNDRGLFDHFMVIDGKRYSFAALGVAARAAVGETISFDWKWDVSRKIRIVDPRSIKTKPRSKANFRSTNEEVAPTGITPGSNESVR